MATNPRMLVILTSILLSAAVIPNVFAVTEVSSAFQIFFSDSSDKLLSREYPDLKIETINLNPANGLPTRDVFGNPILNNELKPTDLVDLKVIWIPKQDVLQKINLDVDYAHTIKESNEINNGGKVE